MKSPEPRGKRLRALKGRRTNKVFGEPCFPARDVRSLADQMRDAGVEVTYTELLTDHGHDGFLAEPHLLAPSLRNILSASSPNGAMAVN